MGVDNRYCVDSIDELARIKKELEQTRMERDALRDDVEVSFHNQILVFFKSTPFTLFVFSLSISTITILLVGAERWL